MTGGCSLSIADKQHLRLDHNRALLHKTHLEQLNKLMLNKKKIIINKTLKDNVFQQLQSWSLDSQTGIKTNPGLHIPVNGESPSRMQCNPALTSITPQETSPINDHNTVVTLISHIDCIFHFICAIILVFHQLNSVILPTVSSGSVHKRGHVY